MADTLDALFNNGLSSEIPMPGTELDFFLDQLPINDTSTFFSVSFLAEVVKTTHSMPFFVLESNLKS